MIKVEKINTYKTFYWSCKSDVYDTERREELKIKFLGITIYKRNKKFNADYFENGKQLIGFNNISTNNK